jgi:hypothetical protein
MKRESTSTLKGLLRISSVCAITLVLLLATGEPLRSDDTDLVRKNTSQPYLMLILDTSASMNLETASTRWLPLNGDDSRSRIYTAKKALYEVFATQTRVNYGFMTFNQDSLRVQSKHWLYVAAEAPDPSWPLAYPKIPSAGGADPREDSFTLGKLLWSRTVAGQCHEPLDLSNSVDRAIANRFSKLGEFGATPTFLWVTPGTNKPVYLLEVALAGGSLGDPTIDLELTSRKVSQCYSGQGFIETISTTKTFQLVGDFLMADSGFRFDDDGAEGGGKDIEDHAGFADWGDARATTTCSSGSPFTGKGIESNYDDPVLFANPTGIPSALQGFLTKDDEYCDPSMSSCDDLKFRTKVDPVFGQFRELDSGDFIPYHWDVSSHQEILRRLNPKHGTGAPPDFRNAAYFTDNASGSATGNLTLRNSSQRPLIAAGETPFGKAINDFRCWYLGPNIGPSGKCRDGNSTIPFDDGWQQIADGRDPDYECRRPYAILITDGEDTCGGENPTADINDFDGFGVKTWIINLGGKEGEKRLNSIIRTSKAEIRTLPPGGNANDLADELRDILGVIESESRAFAAAAVPSVQTEDEQKIFLTSFNPLNASSVWAGSVLAFLKPLPRRTEVDPNGVTQLVPDTSRVCTSTDTEECFLWDAGEVLKTQIKPGNPVGSGEDQRRVVYSQEAQGQLVPRSRQNLGLSALSGAATAVEKDLWRGLGIPFISGNAASETVARSAANDVLNHTYALKTALLDPLNSSSEIEFILGDNFHAEPIVISGPASTQLFVQDYEDYRDFAQKHQFRRKMIAVGSNDGMLHFFDAGIPRKVSQGGTIDVEYDRGSGKEIAAFVPRAALPALKTMSETVEHLWSVDGGLTVADVHLDPVHDGSPNPNDREWRTVLIAGLRRGGESVYALDITQPDPLQQVTITEPTPRPVMIPDVGSSATVPTCWNTTGSGVDDCHDELRFVEPLWEFTDSVEVAGTRIRLDEDGNGGIDFAQSWSKPNIGRIQVNEGGTTVDKFVAIFGGGLDPDEPTARGDWIYMVDIETGQALYKERVVGSAPSEPAAVDTDQDGLLDRIYVGTTEGFLYRVDLGPDASGNLPVLDPFALTVDVGGVPTAVQGQKRITGRTPRIVFDSIDSATGTRLPFYFRPSVIFTPLLSPSFALAIGEGDREDLWSISQRGARFYVFAEDTDTFGGPITADDLEPLTPGSLNTSSDFLFNPSGLNRHGWFIQLGDQERVIADSFALSGITFFSTFIPEVESQVDPNNRKLRLCSRIGDSRAFGVLTTNGNGVLFDANSNRTRSMNINTLVSRAFADLAISKSPPPGGTPSPPPAPPPANLQLIMDELKKLFPSNCRFANYRIDIRAVAADTEVVDIAPVPVCLIEKNWREF